MVRRFLVEPILHHWPSWRRSHGSGIYAYRRTNTMWRCYNTVIFSKNPHIIHPISRPLGRAMGCLLWVQILIYDMPQLLQWCMKYHVNYGPRYSGTWVQCQAGMFLAILADRSVIRPVWNYIPLTLARCSHIQNFRVFFFETVLIISATFRIGPESQGRPYFYLLHCVVSAHYLTS